MQPLVAEHIPGNLAATALIAVLTLVVLWAGFVRNHRRLESRIHARLAAFAGRRLSETTSTQPDEEGGDMVKVLVPVGGPGSHVAVRHVLAEVMKGAALEIHLLNVQPPFSRHVAQFASRKSLGGTAPALVARAAAAAKKRFLGTVRP